MTLSHHYAISGGVACSSWLYFVFLHSNFRFVIIFVSPLQKKRDPSLLVLYVCSKNKNKIHYSHTLCIHNVRSISDFQFSRLKKKYLNLFVDLSNYGYFQLCWACHLNKKELSIMLLTRIATRVCTNRLEKEAARARITLLPDYYIILRCFSEIFVLIFSLNIFFQLCQCDTTGLEFTQINLIDLTKSRYSCVLGCTWEKPRYCVILGY